jgi:TDG/mug DNA glycosylase family protein
MTALPDYLAPDLRVVFCGTAVGMRSASIGHYYAGTGNEFWALLCASGLVCEQLTYADDARILEFGIGLTDVAKHVARSSDAGLADHYDVDGFLAKMTTVRARWVAFHGKTAAGVVSSALGHRRRLTLGRQSWKVAESAVFIVPSSKWSQPRSHTVGGSSWPGGLVPGAGGPCRRSGDPTFDASALGEDCYGTHATQT